MSQLEAVGTPAACSIFVIEPFVGSKNSLFTLVHPPRKPMLNSCGGVGKELAYCLAPHGSTGRWPCCAQKFCAAAEYSQLTNCCACGLALDVAATGVWIRIVC